MGPRDDPRRALYIDLILSGLGADVRAALELKMDLSNYEFKSEYFRTKLENAISVGKAQGLAEGRALGEAGGKAGALLGFLTARGLSVSDALRARILGCSDPARLDRWVVRAATAPSAEDVVGDD